MKCPECEFELPDSMGKIHCPECNTHFIIRVSGTEIKAPVRRERTSQERKRAGIVRRVIITATDAKEDHSLKCFSCASQVGRMTAVRGNIIIGWRPTETVSPLTGEPEIKQIPQFREVFSCYACMGSLNEVLPDKVVNPIKEEKNGVRRNVKDVTRDTVTADENDTTPCDTYVTNEFTRSRNPSVPVGYCLYCGRSESDHHIVEKSRRVYAESFNRA